MRSARMSSCSFRRRVLSAVRKLCRASCCVIVLPPCAARPRRTLANAADAMRMQVEPVMRVEALIFDRDDRVDHMRRDIRQRHVDALFVENREGELVVGIVNDGRLGHVPHTPDRVFAGKTCARTGEQPDAAADHRRRDDGDADGEPRYQSALMLDRSAPPAMQQHIMEIGPEGHPASMCATRGPIRSAVGSPQSATAVTTALVPLGASGRAFGRRTTALYCRLPTADCRLPTADCRLKPGTRFAPFPRSALGVYA